MAVESKYANREINPEDKQPKSSCCLNKLNIYDK